MSFSKIFLFALLALSLLAGASALGQAAVSLDRVNGLVNPETIATNRTIDFVLRLTNTSGQVAIGVTNGFRVYSPDGAEWGGTSIDTTEYLGRSQFPMGVYLREFSVTGSGADTVAFLGVGENIGIPSGLPADYDATGLVVSIGPIPESSAALTICLDSSFFYNGGEWLWVLEEPTETIPSWDGPHCYRVHCCSVIGDANFDGAGPDIADLILLSQYLFTFGDAPPCIDNCDVNGSGGDPDVSDLIYLLQWMFFQGPPLVPCEQP